MPASKQPALDVAESFINYSADAVKHKVANEIHTSKKICEHDLQSTVCSFECRTAH